MLMVLHYATYWYANYEIEEEEKKISFYHIYCSLASLIRLKEGVLFSDLLLLQAHGAIWRKRCPILVR